MRKHHHNKSRAKQRKKRRTRANYRAIHNAERKEQEERDARVTSEYGERAHRMCGRKLRYKTKSSALSRAAHCAVHTGYMLKTYKCPYCGGWHLTSS